jgi:hypothetical protein
MTSLQTPIPDVLVIERRRLADYLKLIDARQAAHYTRFSVATIRRACRSHELQHLRIGHARGPIRSRTEWLDAWMMRGTQGPLLD